MAEGFLDLVKDKSNAFMSTVHDHFASMTDTTSALAKQKFLQVLLSSGIIQSQHIRDALQIGV